jgi:hypothetical protein
MSTDEALAYIHGEMETVKDGDVTHQAIQTNLADVICGGDYHYNFYVQFRTLLEKSIEISIRFLHRKLT